MTSPLSHIVPASRLRLLWVKAGRLLPLDTGGKLRSYHLARQLAARHQLTMLTYYDGKADPAYESQVAEAFRGAITLRTGVGTSRGADVRRYLARLASPAPFAVSKFHSRQVEGIVTDAARSRQYDVIICDFLSASLNFRHADGTPLLLFQHNVESALWQRQARHAPNVVARLAFTLEAAKMSRYEALTMRRFDHVVAVSEHDRSLMSAFVDPARITVVPTGVDTSRFRTARDVPATAPLVMFLGSMDWHPNIDGVEWLCSEMWPRITREVPMAKLRVVGRNPHPSVQRLASDTVEITGTVPSVVEHLAEAAVVVVPLRVGGGTRLKIFEAMAAGRPVVSTTVGAEGLDVADGEGILFADDPESFAGAVIRVLRDTALRERLSRGAITVSSRYDWSSVVNDFEAALAQLVARRPPARIARTGVTS